MPSSFSSLLRLELMQTGEKTNTWGDITNTNLGTLLEKAIAGTTSVSVAASDVTLTAQNGADDQSRSAIIVITGSPGVTRNVIAPSSSKTYVVSNGSNASVVFKGSATTGVTLVAGERATLAWTGSDFVRIGAAQDSPSFTGNATFANITTTGNTALGDAVSDTFAVSGSTVKNSSGQWFWAAPTSGFHEIRGLAAANALRISDGTNYAIHLKQKGGSMGFVGAEAGFLFGIGANDTSMLTFTTAGNAAFAAPSSGTTVDITGLAGATQALRALVTGGDANIVASSVTSGNASFKAITTGIFTHEWRSNRSNSSLEFLQDSTVMMSFNSSRAATMNAPAAGSTLTLVGGASTLPLTVNFGSGASAYTQWQVAGSTKGYIGTGGGGISAGFTTSTFGVRSDSTLLWMWDGGDRLTGTGTALNLLSSGGSLNFTDTGPTLVQINSYNSNALELVTRNAAAVVKMYSGNAVAALTLSTTQAIFGHSLHNNAVVPTGTVNQPPGMSGTSNPSITSISNLTGTPTSLYESWERTGNRVTVSGVLAGVVTTTVNNVITVQLTFPIAAASSSSASALVARMHEANGTSAGNAGGPGTWVNASALQIGVFSQVSGSHTVSYEYSYLVG